VNETISVVIPAYNSEKFLEKAVRSVIAQERLPEEILIIDDGSTDGTQRVAEELISGQKGAKPQIKYIRQANQGPAVARNTGLKNASGDYIAFLDADDSWLPERLKTQLAVFQTDPNAGLVCSGRVRVDETTGQRTLNCEGDKLSGDGYLDLWTYRNYITTSSVLARKRCLDEVGGFDEDPRVLGSEDAELWLRIAEKFKIVYVNKPLVEYLVREGGINRSNIQRSYKSAVFIIQKHEPEFRRRYENATSIVQNKWRRIYHAWGVTLFDNEQFGEAKAKFRTAMTFGKISPQTIRFYLLTLLGPSVLMVLKRWRTK